MGMWLGSVYLDVCFVITKWGRPFLSKKNCKTEMCIKLARRGHVNSQAYMGRVRHDRNGSAVLASWKL
jgi:hypothetical protein